MLRFILEALLLQGVTQTLSQIAGGAQHRLLNILKLQDTHHHLAQ